MIENLTEIFPNSNQFSKLSQHLNLWNPVLSNTIQPKIPLQLPLFHESSNASKDQLLEGVGTFILGIARVWWALITAD